MSSSSTAFTTATATATATTKTTTTTATAPPSSPSSESMYNMKWESVPSMNLARDGMGVATLANTSVGSSLMMAIGGGDNHGNYFKSIEVYGSDIDISPTQATVTTTRHGRPTNPNNRSTWYWKDGPEMTIPRSSLGVGVIDNNLYAVGGRNHTGILDVLEIFDHQRGTWSTGPRMQECRRNMGVTTSLDGTLYVVGGENHTFTTVKSVELYDPATAQWTSGVSMKTPRQGCGACSLDDGKVYVMGGLDAQGNRLKSLEIFDPSTQEWSSGPQMLSPHIYIGNSVSVFQGKIYVVDTGSSAKPTSTSTTTTEEVGDQLSRYSSYVTGGSSQGSSSKSSVEIFDPVTQEWSVGPVLPGPKLLSLGSSVLDNELYAVGGYNVKEGAPTNSVSVLTRPN